MKNHINIIKKLVGSICVIIQIFLFVGMPSIAVQDDKENGLSKST